MRTDLQYLSDSILIEDVAALEFGLTKQAGLFDTLGLSGVASSIKSFVSENVSSDAPGGVVGGVFDILLSGALFKANPIVGVIYQIARQFGFDINSVIKKILGALKPKLDKGEQVTSEDVNSIGKSVIAPMTGTAAPNDLFESLRKMSQNGQLQKLAASSELDAFRKLLTPGASAVTPEISFLGGGGGSLISKVFGTLFNLPSGKGKAVWLLGGFVIWIVKTALLGAGLMAGAGAISGMLGHKKPSTEGTLSTEVSQSTTNPENDSSIASEVQTKSPIAKSPATPTSSQKLWIVPLVGDGSVEGTLVAWALDLYPNLDKYDNVEKTIEASPMFRATAALLKRDPNRMGARSMVMPHEFSSRKQVVDTFIDDVIKALG